MGSFWAIFGGLEAKNDIAGGKNHKLDTLKGSFVSKPDILVKYLAQGNFFENENVYHLHPHFV